MSDKSKKVGEIFSDYNTSSNIKYAEVTALNVVKKTNTLQVVLYFDEYIEIKEIWYLEKFLRERFQFGQVHMIIQYQEGVRKKSIEFGIFRERNFLQKKNGQLLHGPFGCIRISERCNALYPCRRGELWTYRKQR